MRAVIQRVASARVRVGDRIVGEIGRGVLVLAAVGRDDADEDVTYLAGKIRDARIFEGEDGKPMDRSVADIGGSVLVVSQFTLFGDMRKGRRPSFDAAGSPELARAHGVALYPFFLEGVAMRPELNQPDGLHPNARGVAQIVERIAPRVADLLGDRP